MEERCSRVQQCATDQRGPACLARATYVTAKRSNHACGHRQRHDSENRDKGSARCICAICHRAVNVDRRSSAGPRPLRRSAQARRHRRLQQSAHRCCGGCRLERGGKDMLGAWLRHRPCRTGSTFSRMPAMHLFGLQPRCSARPPRISVAPTCQASRRSKYSPTCLGD